MKRLAHMFALAMFLTVCVGCEDAANSSDGTDEGGAEGGSGTSFVVPADNDHDAA